MGRYLTGDRARKMRGLLLSVYGARCAKCGQVIDLNIKYPDPFSFSIGHQQPVSKGGTDNIENLRPEHLICNIKAKDGQGKSRRLEEVNSHFF